VDGAVTTQSSIAVAHDNELYVHLKRMAIVGPVVMGIGLTVVVVACTVVFEEREKRLKIRPGEKEAEEKKQKKGKYDLIVAKFKEEYNEAHVNDAFVADEANSNKDKRRSSVYSMDTAMKCASNLLISPFRMDSNDGQSPRSAESTTCVKTPPSDGQSPEIITDNGWLKKGPLSDKRPNNRLMPLPALAPLYGSDDNTSLRDPSWNYSQGSLSSTMNSINNTPAKIEKKDMKKNKSRDSSLTSIRNEESCLPEQNGGTRISISVEPQVKVTEAEPVKDDVPDCCTIVIQPSDSAKHLHPEVLILNETKASPDYDSSDQGSGIIETKWNTFTTTGHK
jgi:hypothetical protein